LNPHFLDALGVSSKLVISPSSGSPMNTNGPKPIAHNFGLAASFIARQAGRPAAFILALTVVFLWAVTGPIFHYSDTWQLVINTGTTIITFLMVFLIQNSQNRDGAAIQVKLDELIRVGEGKNFFVGIEHLDDEEIERLRSMLEKRTKSNAVKEIEAKAEKAADEAHE
jgi:low affinity Fe/Cu permease